MKKIKIVGVPEHFNLPWHLAIQQGKFENEGIELIWTDIPEGTGKMCQLLKNEETDLAVILTEGIIKDICNGNPSRIVQKYIETPLIWGIHVDKNSPFQKISDLENRRVAISRIGSGSQLMAFVNAKNNQWQTPTDFEIVNTIDGAVTALKDGKADYFMWEKFMTKPLVDNGTFRHLGDCPTPWPCFVIAASEKMYTENAEILQTLLNVINKFTCNIKKEEYFFEELCSKFPQENEDLSLWLSKTEWSQSQFDENELNKIQKQLIEFHIIDKIFNFENLTYTKT